MTTTITAVGKDGTITFDGALITIERSGKTLLGPKGRGQQLALAHVTAVDFNPGTRLAAGWIDFALPGSGPLGGTPAAAARRATTSPTAVLFSHRKHLADFKALHDAITHALAELRAGGA
ncbi:DUF4429 domain-containing protein [Streptomyces alboflavus]|uniref:DUF4429 domain-containing protein n=1 Tax=Streptomyces alboflavus TaxID=67267 RepID=UPI003674FECD